MLMLDAGSTGSRIHIYRFNYCHGPSPSLENEIFEQLKPGLSHTKFVTPKDAADSLDPLLKLAMEHVPEDARKCTPVSVKATAGLRMLKDGKGDRILEAVAEKLRTEYPFPLVEPGGVEIMPGKDEGRAFMIPSTAAPSRALLTPTSFVVGVYAWITVNYLLKRIGQKAREPTAAVMDLGGGSTQIVFEPHQEEPMEEGDHKFEVPFGDHTYTLYQHSYDGYGLMQGRKRIKEAGVLDKTHPCYAVGHSESYTGDDGQVHAIAGTGGDHGLCHKFITNLFDKQTCPVPNRPVSPSRVSSSTSQCSFNGIYQPSLSSSFANSDIYAFSYFYDKFAEPFGKLSDKGFSVGQLRAAAEAVCSGQTVMDDASLTDGERAAAELLKADPEWCTDLGFMYGLLSVGYEIPDERVLKTAKKIDGVEVGWSLGAALKVVDTWGTEGKGHCLKEIVS
ncbi:Guanosine-diphosphatase [Thoreauomyces humboldtii]|nr:Guanosine-diphosphatase [Thoreauomyces humboldtii]